MEPSDWNRGPVGTVDTPHIRPWYGEEKTFLDSNSERFFVNRTCRSSWLSAFDLAYTLHSIEKRLISITWEFEQLILLSLWSCHLLPPLYENVGLIGIDLYQIPIIFGIKVKVPLSGRLYKSKFANILQGSCIKDWSINLNWSTKKTLTNCP